MKNENEIPATLYKVLVEGASCHGSDMKWSLPEGDQPGEWHEVEGPLIKCRHGFHLTDQPARWWKSGCTVYLVEAEEVEGYDISDAKCIARRVRLIRELTEDELFGVFIFNAGVHSVAAGRHGIALGNSTVKAWGNSTVKALDNSTVEAWGNSTVKAWGNSTVKALDNSTVKALDNSTVEAWGNSTVEALGNSTVKALDNSTVKALDNSTAISPHWSSAKVEIKDQAVHVDRREGKPKVYVLD